MKGIGDEARRLWSERKIEDREMNGV